MVVTRTLPLLACRRRPHVALSCIAVSRTLPASDGHHPHVVVAVPVDVLPMYHLRLALT
jgi:hypothetical protein